ncbi:MAG: M15 family metallopeptidase [Pseudobdellovibrionaceae bacterium]
MKLFVYLAAFVSLSIFIISDISLADEPSMQLKCLWASYRNFKISSDFKTIVLPDGRVLPYQSKGQYELGKIDPGNLTSIDQMYFDHYPYGFTLNSLGEMSYAIPQKQNDLRGSRYEPFFLYLYGETARKIEKDLVPVRWLDGSFVLFNQRYGAARALTKVVYELYSLTRNHPEIEKYLKQPLGGTYQWRHISHSKNLSSHSFGTAIDINISYSSYWRWELGSDGVPHYHNYVPPIIAKAFEDNGFIWGGKWYHFDTMHFEYRPELLMNHSDCERIFRSSYPADKKSL